MVWYRGFDDLCRYFNANPRRALRPTAVEWWKRGRKSRMWSKGTDGGPPIPAIMKNMAMWRSEIMYKDNFFKSLLKGDKEDKQ